MRNHMCKFTGVIFVFLASCASIPFTNPYQISKVIEQDKALSSQMQQDVSSGISEKEALEKMIRGMRKISIAGTPPEFAEAYRRHIQAWEEFSDEQGALGFFKAIAIGMIAGITANPGLFLTYANEQKGLSDKITTTWYEVEAIAARYSVTIE